MTTFPSPEPSSLDSRVSALEAQLRALGIDVASNATSAADLVAVESTRRAIGDTQSTDALNAESVARQALLTGINDRIGNEVVARALGDQINASKLDLLASTAGNLVATAQALSADKIFPITTALNPLAAVVLNRVAEGDAFLVQGAANGDSYASLYRRGTTAGGNANVAVSQSLDIPTGDYIRRAGVAATTQAAIATAQALLLSGSVNYLADVAGAPASQRLFDRRANSFVQTIYGFSFAVGTEVEVGRPLDFVRAQFWLPTGVVSFRLFWVKKLLADANINTAYPNTWTAIGDRIFSAADAAAIGVFAGSPTNQKIPFFDLPFTTTQAREDGYAFGCYIQFYDGDNATGNIVAANSAITAVTGDGAYKRGFTRTSVATWLPRPDGSGISWELWGKKAPGADQSDTATARRVTAKVEASLTTSVAAYHTSAQTAFIAAAGGWNGATVLIAVSAGLKLHSLTVPMTVVATATQVRLKVAAREADDPRIDVYPYNTNTIDPAHRHRSLSTPVILTVAQAGLTAGSTAQVDVTFPLLSLNLSGGDNTKFEFMWEALDASGAVVGTGYGYANATLPTNESGWMRFATQAQLFKVAHTLYVEKYSTASASVGVRSPSRRYVETLGNITWAGTTLTVPANGSSVVDMRGAASAFAGTVVVTLPAAGAYRYDQLVLVATTGALALRVGTPQPAGTLLNGPGSYAAETPGKATGGDVTLAMIAMNSAAIVGVVPNFDVVGGFARRSMMAWLVEEQARARAVFHYVLKRFAPGQTVNITAVGDSILQLGGGGASYATPNGVLRDRPEVFLATDPAIAFAGIELFDAGDGAGMVHGYFSPWMMMVKRLRDLGVVVNWNNFGVNGAQGGAANGLVDATLRASVVATNPHVVVEAYGMNDVIGFGAAGAPTLRDAIVSFHNHILANCSNYLGMIVDTPYRAAPSFSANATYATWAVYQDALFEAVGTINAARTSYRAPGAIIVPWLPGQPENIGIIGRLEQDVCGSNQVNHPGVAENRAKVNYLDWLLF